MSADGQKQKLARQIDGQSMHLGYSSGGLECAPGAGQFEVSDLTG